MERGGGFSGTILADGYLRIIFSYANGNIDDTEIFSLFDLLRQFCSAIGRLEPVGRVFVGSVAKRYLFFFFFF